MPDPQGLPCQEEHLGSTGVTYHSICGMVSQFLPRMTGETCNLPLYLPELDGSDSESSLLHHSVVTGIVLLVIPEGPEHPTLESGTGLCHLLLALSMSLLMNEFLILSADLGSQVCGPCPGMSCVLFSSRALSLMSWKGRVVFYL